MKSKRVLTAVLDEQDGVSSGRCLSERAFPPCSEMLVHNIDMHYHAGRERPEGTTLDQFIQHARISGRRVVGLTDHLGKYNGDNAEGTSYKPTMEGFGQYRRDMERVQKNFPDLRLFLAPEIGPWGRPRDLCRTLKDLSDFFICEAAFPSHTSISKNTKELVEKIRETREIMELTGKPAYIAHPFRSAINLRLIKYDLEPWVTESNHKGKENFLPEELNKFFLLDIERVGRAAAEMNVPLEVNGNTQFRIRSSNLPAPLQMVWSAFKTLKICGCELVPGSDQHGFTVGVGRIGGAVPADCFDFLGITASDMPLVRRLLMQRGDNIIRTA